MSYPDPQGTPQRPVNDWQSPASQGDTMGQLEWQRRQDKEQLNVLAILYYVSAGLHGLYALFMLGYFVLFGALFGSGMDGRPSPGQPDPAAFSAIFYVIGAVTALVGGGFTWLTVYAGLSVARRKNLTLIQIVAAFTCLSVPLGTGLGVFTFIVLNRPTVRELFEPQR